MNVLDLFSGIGGFSIGLERAGMKTIAFCESDLFARSILSLHWPGIPIHNDVRTLDGNEYRGKVDVICGGFPCQDISSCGKKAGIHGTRSGLWFEFARIIGVVQPRFAIMENVSALLHRGLECVLGELASIGYDAEWHCIPACAVGADHRRDRVWIVAYPEGSRRGSILEQSGLFQEACENSSRLARDRRSFYCADAKRFLRETEPGLDRVADDVPARMDRIRCLGNAVIPQITEIIGRALMDA